jgi:hypothetical protein
MEAVNRSAWSAETDFINVTGLDAGEQFTYDLSGNAPTDWSIQASTF